MPEPKVAQRKRLVLLGVLIAIVGVFGLVPSPFASAQSGESVETTLLARREDPEAERIPIEGTEIRVFDAVIVDREIESIGDEVGRATSDATGFVSMPVPGPARTPSKSRSTRCPRASNWSVPTSSNCLSRRAPDSRPECRSTSPRVTQQQWLATRRATARSPGRLACCSKASSSG